MAGSERITISVPDALASRIRDAVQAGDYGSISDVVEDAVRLWSDQRDVGEQEAERLRQAWDAGKASGLHGELDFAELRREARDLLTENAVSKARTSDPGHAR